MEEISLIEACREAAKAREELLKNCPQASTVYLSEEESKKRRKFLKLTTLSCPICGELHEVEADPERDDRWGIMGEFGCLQPDWKVGDAFQNIFRCTNQRYRVWFSMGEDNHSVLKIEKIQDIEMNFDKLRKIEFPLFTGKKVPVIGDTLEDTKQYKVVDIFENECLCSFTVVAGTEELIFYTVMLRDSWEWDGDSKKFLRVPEPLVEMSQEELDNDMIIEDYEIPA